MSTYTKKHLVPILTALAVLHLSTLAHAVNPAFVDSVALAGTTPILLSLDYKGGPDPTFVGIAGVFRTINISEEKEPHEIRHPSISNEFSIRVEQKAADRLRKEMSDNLTTIESLHLYRHLREATYDKKVFFRHTLFGLDEKLYMTITDDPSPLVVAGAIIAGGAVAICGIKVISDAVQCKDRGVLTIRVKANGLECSAYCRGN